MKLIRRVLTALAVSCLFAGIAGGALAQTSMQPYVITGPGTNGGRPPTAPVGSSPGVPMPVTISGSVTASDVNLTGINGSAPVTASGTATGALRVELPTNGTGVVGLNAGSNIIGNVRIDQTTPGTTNGVVINSGTVTANNPVGITPTDRTITSASGSSETIMAANSSRHSLIIQNIGNANCGVNPTGGTAVIGGAGTLTLLPTGSYQPRIPTLSAVTVICTAGQPIYAEEN